MAEQLPVPTDDIPTPEEVRALKELNAHAENIRLANRLILIIGLLCIGTGLLTLPFIFEWAFLILTGGGYLVALSGSKSPTSLQKHNLPQLASTRDLKALGPLCYAALCADRKLRTLAENSLGTLIRFHLESDSLQMRSETAALLKILTRTRNVDLIYCLLDWVVVAQPDDAVRALNRLAKSSTVRQSDVLAEAVSKCRTTVVEARLQYRGADLLRASSAPVPGDLLLPAEPRSIVDSSNLLRPSGETRGAETRRDVEV